MIRKPITKGFTLIELLIVVAIIAILAAIAVPNLLEAQTRSKVARTKADMRSLATAIEAYAVDFNGPLIGWREFRFGWGPAGSNDYPNASTDEGWGDLYMWIFNRLTTPVAYMASIPWDPFNTASKYPTAGNAKVPLSHPASHYYGYESICDTTRNGYPQGSTPFKVHGGTAVRWTLESWGPSRQQHEFANGTGRVIVASFQCGTPPPAGSYLPRPDGIYDPSNGTVSVGMIIRSNKGAADGSR